MSRFIERSDAILAQHNLKVRFVNGPSFSAAPRHGTLL